MRLINLAALAAVLACNPDSPGTTATTTGTGTTTGSTGSTATTDTTTASSGELTTSGGTATAGMTSTPTTSTSTSTSTATTDPGTTDPATSTTSSTTTPETSTTDDTGAVDPTCLPAVGDYGGCQAVLGWAFDGVECTLRSGCDCAPDCDKFFPDAVACATTCAAADNCNPDRFDGAGLAEDPVQGDHCDGIYMCPGGDAALKQAYQQIFGMLTCEPGDFPCGPEHCAGLWAGTLGPDEWTKMCAASLLPMSGPLFCVVFGP